MRQMMILVPILFSVSVSAAHGPNDCEDALRKPVIYKTEEVELFPAEVSILEAAIDNLENAKLTGQGTRWLEERYNKRRTELMTAVKSASFKKLYHAKPQVADLVKSWSAGLAKLSEIDAAFEKLSDVERKAFVQVYDAIRSALTSHALSFTKVSSRELEFNRVQLILDEIKNFDVEKPKYSFYRIKRAIETRHSLREYAECR